jgi:hypothetical protein
VLVVGLARPELVHMELVSRADFARPELACCDGRERARPDVNRSGSNDIFGCAYSFIYLMLL